MQDERSFLSLRDIASVLFKRKTLIISVAAASTVTCLCYVLLMWPTYESASQILVRLNFFRSENVSLNQVSPGPTTILRQVSQADEINTMMAILKSRDLVAEIIDDMDLTEKEFDKAPDYRRYSKIIYKGIRRGLSVAYNEIKYVLHISKRPTPEESREIERERFIRTVTDALVVEQIPGSEVLQLGVRCSNPRLAQQFSDVLYEKSVSWYPKVVYNSGNLFFYQQRAQEARKEVEKIERELAEMLDKFKLVGFEDRKTLLVENQFHARSRLNEVNSRTAALEAGLQHLEDMVSNEPSLIIMSKETSPNPAYRKMAEKLADLEVKKIEANTKFKETGRFLADLEDRVAEGKTLLKKTPRKIQGTTVEGVNSVHQALRETLLDKSAELAALNAEKMVIMEQIKQYEQDLSFLNNHVYRVGELKRQLASQSGIYNNFLKNIELARVDEERQNARIVKLSRIQSAQLPLSPIKPRKLTYTLIAGCVGLLLGVSWAFVLEFNDNTFGSEADLKEVTDWPLLGTLRRYKTK